SGYLKGGASGVEPAAQAAQEGGVAVQRMNGDIGDQSEGGANGSVLGHIGTPAGDCTSPVWDVRRLESEQPLEMTSAPDGTLWLPIGVDSGFEGRTEIYFARVRAHLHPI